MPVGSILGRAVRRTEDPRFLTGVARYVDDLPCEGALHAVVVRSTVAHGRIAGIDAEAAEGMPGVVGVFTASDLDLPVRPAGNKVHEAFARHPFAREIVRYVGEPIAMVVAETRVQAVDAAEVVFVDVDPLPAVASVARALESGAPLLFPEAETNLARRDSDEGGDDPLEGAEVVVRGRFVNQRVAPVPMEPNAVLAAPDAQSGGLTIWVPHQAPFWFQRDIAEYLGLETSQVHVIAPAVGGGFGAKASTYPEQLAVAALALRLQRPVRLMETRSENMVAMTHGRAQVHEVELGATRAGRITGLRLRVLADMGAYPHATYLPPLTRKMASGVYRIPRIEVVTEAVVTNTTPIDAYRGAGRPEAAAMIERTVDLLARELDMDPVDVRRVNLIPPDAFPYETPTGAIYDVGDYEAALDLALEVAGYEQLRREQAERRASGGVWQLGIGVSVYCEITGWDTEFGAVEVHEDGSATVRVGTSPQGQGHETAWAQLVEGTLGIPMAAVRVIHSDTALLPRGEGTGGSRSLQVGGSAILRASEGVLDKARRLAAHLLEAGVEDVELFDDGRLGIVGAPDTALTWTELATAAASPDRLPEGMEPGLAAETDFEMERNTFPFGAHVAVAEVDVETGKVRLLRHVAVDDCGRILNPLLVDGQVHGGVAQGAAQALYEEVVYDEEGTPLTANLTAYEIPSAADLPPIETAHTQTPTPLNPLGAKGIGESGTIGSTPAVQSAVIDAVAHLGVRHIDMPLSPERVWRAIGEASGGM